MLNTFISRFICCTHCSDCLPKSRVIPCLFCLAVIVAVGCATRFSRLYFVLHPRLSSELSSCSFVAHTQGLSCPSSLTVHEIRHFTAESTKPRGISRARFLGISRRRSVHHFGCCKR